MTAPREQNPWYIETFLAISGWLAGLLAAAAIFALAGFFFAGMGEGGDIATAFLALLLGGGFVLLGVAVRNKSGGDFARHFSIASIAAGLTAATGGFWYLAYQAIEPAFARDGARVGASGLVTTAALSAAAWLVNRRVQDGILAFLSMLVVYVLFTESLLLTFLDAGAPDEEVFGVRLDLVTTPLFVLAGAFLFIRDGAGRLVRAAAAAMLIGPFLSYPILMTLDGLGLDAGRPALYRVGDLILAATLGWTLWRLRDVANVLVLVIALVLGVAAALFYADYSVVALIILATGMAGRHRGLAAVGVAALAWSIVRYYYDLNVTLLTKSMIIALMGVATIAAALVVKRPSILSTSASEVASKTAMRRPLLQVLAVAGALGASLFLVNTSVNRLETAFRDAQTIYLPLGPRDPRSLIQGDYMVLRFDNALYPKRDVVKSLPRDGEVFLKLDENSVASFSRLSARGDAPNADEIRVDYVKTSKWRMRYCPETFFFQEGEAELFNGARFAVVKVAADGATRLTALADQDRTVITPAAAEGNAEESGGEREE